MEREKKTSQIIVRVTEKEKDFLIRKAEEEDRTISSVIHRTLEEKYPEYKKIRKNMGKESGEKENGRN